MSNKDEIKKQIEYAHDDIKAFVIDKYGFDDETGRAMNAGALMMKNRVMEILEA